MMLAHNNYPFYHGQQQQQQQAQQLHPHQLQLQQSYEQFNQQQPQQLQQQQQLQQGHFAASHPAAAFSTTLDNLPTAAAAFAATQRYHHRRPATLSSQGVTSMSSNSWMLHGQHTPRRTQQFGHQRDSSLSSVGSNPPASPYNANTANPQIAVTDAVGDGLHDITGAGENHYTFSMTKPMAISDTFYATTVGPFDNSHGGGGTSGHHAMGDMATADGLPALTGAQQHRQGGLAPAPDMPTSSVLSRSRPVSVASSIGGDSPATPPIHEHEDEHRRRKNGEGPDSPVLFPLDSDLDYVNDCLHFRFDDIAYANGANTPKLDRTMTDVYGDELYSPNFTITSASPPPQTRMAMSPPSDLFTQRIQAANSQHFLATQSPVSNDSGAQSPFRHDSPYASAINEFPKVGTTRVRLESAQQLRERRKAEEDVKQLQRQMARHAQRGQEHRQQQQSTPTTISPKDAVLEFNETDTDSNFPLFPPQETNTYGLGPSDASGDISRAATQPSASPFQSLSTTPVQSGFSFSMPSNVQLPHQYPFIPRQQPQQQPQQQHQQHQQHLTPSASTFSRMSSAEASNTDGGSSTGGPIQKPDRTAADGGTYTCTYHGCTLRFDTPALLQKHKREGHRQASTLNHLRSPAIMGQVASSVASSQAGPHRCDRVNPSTGKPCNTVFSRPYDLTRHEDTIHNAKKQKVRCGLCTEEKLFSRADALTRHYRVCHPDVEVPGKHRRRGV
ncbi:hypothetical protein F5Y12DRAFT_92487 [Xylaria sp. FL1777]|nr:hypothetical protein F5Y12DRAFT_92487 [Xylaria sp. FL1777]